MNEVIFIGLGGALAGLVLGAAVGVFWTGRTMRRRFSEIGEEVVQLRAIAERNLVQDDPDLPTLLRNLNTAVEQAYRAVDALEQQHELTKQKTKAGKEVLTASRHIMDLFEDMGAELPETTYSAPKEIAATPKKQEPPVA